MKHVIDKYAFLVWCIILVLMLVFLFSFIRSFVLVVVFIMTSFCVFVSVGEAVTLFWIPYLSRFLVSPFLGRL